MRMTNTKTFVYNIIHHMLTAQSKEVLLGLINLTSYYKTIKGTHCIIYNLY